MCYFRLCNFAKFFMSFLKAQVSFPSKSSVSSNITPLQLKVYNIHWLKEPIKQQIFRFLSIQVKIHQISHVMPLFIDMTHDSSVNFKLINFLLWTKGSHQSPNFDTSECSGENLPNSSCQF